MARKAVEGYRMGPLYTPPSLGEVAFRDTNYAERTGWKEVVVEAGSGIRLLSSTAPSQDRSQVLTRFPPDMAAPLQDVSARFRFSATQTAFLARAVGVLPSAMLTTVLSLGALATLFWWRRGNVDSGQAQTSDQPPARNSRSTSSRNG